MMQKKLLPLAVQAACAVMASGCATQHSIRVPVPVPCVVDLPAVPQISTDAELRAMSDYRLVLAIARERLQLLGYSAEVRAAAEGCAPKPALQPAPVLDRKGVLGLGIFG